MNIVTINGKKISTVNESMSKKDYYSERKESCNDDDDVKYNDDNSVCAHAPTLFHALI